MEITSKEYKRAYNELVELQDIYNAVEQQAKVFKRYLEKIENQEEIGLLVIELGKTLDIHAKNMSEI